MPDHLHSISDIIRAGSVIIDRAYVFEGDEDTRAKHYIILSNTLIEDSYVYCLTTSKTGTYSGSFAEYIKASDPALGNDIIIELERISLIKISVLQKRYDAGNLVVSKDCVLSPELLTAILERIEDSERIPEYIKDWLI